MPYGTCTKMSPFVQAETPIEAALAVVARHKITRCSSGYDISVALDSVVGFGPARQPITEALYALLYS